MLTTKSIWRCVFINAFNIILSFRAASTLWMSRYVSRLLTLGSNVWRQSEWSSITWGNINIWLAWRFLSYCYFLDRNYRDKSVAIQINHSVDRTMILYAGTKYLTINTSSNSMNYTAWPRILTHCKIKSYIDNANIFSDRFQESLFFVFTV